MIIEIIAALLFRTLGVILFLTSLFVFISLAISYYSVSSSTHADITHNVYFFVFDTIIWGSILSITGLIFIFLSKPLGRLLAKGLT